MFSFCDRNICHCYYHFKYFDSMNNFDFLLLSIWWLSGQWHLNLRCYNISVSSWKNFTIINTIIVIIVIIVTTLMKGNIDICFDYFTSYFLFFLHAVFVTVGIILVVIIMTQRIEYFCFSDVSLYFLFFLDVYFMHCFYLYVYSFHHGIIDLNCGW